MLRQRRKNDEHCRAEQTQGGGERDGQPDARRATPPSAPRSSVKSSSTRRGRGVALAVTRPDILTAAIQCNVSGHAEMRVCTLSSSHIEPSARARRPARQPPIGVTSATAIVSAPSLAAVIGKLLSAARDALTSAACCGEAFDLAHVLASVPSTTNRREKRRCREGLYVRARRTLVARRRRVHLTFFRFSSRSARMSVSVVFAPTPDERIVIVFASMLPFHGSAAAS